MKTKYEAKHAGKLSRKAKRDLFFIIFFISNIMFWI